jgi:1-acyl-sn-glycerol-3-phosphate acyltransferase
MFSIKETTEIGDHRTTGSRPRTVEPKPPTPINYIHSLIAIPLIYLCTALMASLSLLLSLFDKDGSKQHWCAQVWSRILARLAGTEVRVYGLEHIQPGTSYVFLSSHQSYMDIPVMLGYLPAQLRIAAKKELFRIPFLGWHLRRAGHLAIDRSSSAEAIATLQRAANGIRNGICAFIFPEGTRSKDGTLQPFKKGGFKLAIQSKAPIVPITILGSRQVLPRDSIIFRSGPIDMFIDPPIPTKDLKEEELIPLMDKVHTIMANHFIEHPTQEPGSASIRKQ